MPFNGNVNLDLGDSVEGWSQSLRFNAGTIKRVAIDVSGEPYIDLEREVQGMLMRE